MVKVLNLPKTFSAHMQAIKETNFQFKGQTGFYRGKVRDVYYFGDQMAMVSTDRISAFDVVLPRAIPDKGRILNQIAAFNLNATRDVVPNWVIESPNPNVTVGYKCEPVAVEMVVRGYLAGHAWREYKLGKREICGVPLPDGMNENDKFPRAIITPTTKALVGHDEDISKEEIIARGLVSKSDYETMREYSINLFAIGTELAAQRRLLLVDTKYEFGRRHGKIHLIDEVHTPDSSRYFYKDGYAGRQRDGEPQKQLSKEFVRQWLMENGFQGKENQPIPEMTDELVKTISDRYRELYYQMMGEAIRSTNYDNILERIESSIINSIK